MIRREVRRLSLPMRGHFHAPHGSGLAGHRELAVVHLVDTDTGHEGWGECAALNTAGYTAESARGAYALLASGAPIDRATAPMAAAALDMAELDLELRRSDASLASHLGLGPATVTAGATIGFGAVDDVSARADELVASGYRRLKLKISPETALDSVAAVRSRHGEIELHVDANGSFDRSDMEMLDECDQLEVSVIEQPLAPDDIDGLGALRSRLEAKILIDEGGRPRTRLDRILVADVVDGVVVKPGCIGGIAAAVELLDRCAAAGLDASVGGMVESSLGRHSLAVLAAHDAATVIGDVSPSSLWLAADPWPDLAFADGVVTVPDEVGIVDPPDPIRLEAATVELSELPN